MISNQISGAVPRALSKLIILSDGSVLRLLIIVTILFISRIIYAIRITYLTGLSFQVASVVSKYLVS